MDNPTEDHLASQGPVAQPLLVRRADLGLSTPWEEPQSETEMRLAEIWQQVLDIDMVGRLDDFFELRGDSLAATSLAAEIEATFDIRFAPGDIISLSTVAKQACAVAPSALSHAARVPPYMVVGRAEGSKPPLFMVHGAAGFSFFKREFLDAAGQDRPIYLFQAPGLDGRTEPLKTVEEIASAYIQSLREIQPMGPYHLAAMCAGSFIALEMCNQLADNGQSVARLILLDPQRVPDALVGRYRTPPRNLQGIRSFLSRILWACRGLLDPFKREQIRRAKILKRQEMIGRRRRGEQVDLVPPEERSYSPEKMLAASMQLYEALRTHVPRRYSGKAAIRLTKKKARNISFWQDYVGSIDFELCDGRHTEMFSAQIVETAGFVRNVLESPSEAREDL
jgi:thioesterase domain-containing protein/acyl carrier protein